MNVLSNELHTLENPKPDITPPTIEHTNDSNKSNITTKVTRESQMEDVEVLQQITQQNFKDIVSKDSTIATYKQQINELQIQLTSSNNEIQIEKTKFAKLNESHSILQKQYEREISEWKSKSNDQESQLLDLQDSVELLTLDKEQLALEMEEMQVSSNKSSFYYSSECSFILNRISFNLIRKRIQPYQHLM